MEGKLYRNLMTLIAPFNFPDNVEKTKQILDDAKQSIYEIINAHENAPVELAYATLKHQIEIWFGTLEKKENGIVT